MPSLMIEQLPETRREILRALKRDGAATISHLAASLNLTGEAVRQQLLQLQREGWVDSRIERDAAHPKSGRPATRYSLSEAGDHLFPKQYDKLALSIFDSIDSALGEGALEKVLSRVCDARVEAWAPLVRELPLRQRLEVLKEIYARQDPYTEVVAENGTLLLVERNCPFINTALQRPAVCSVTVHALTRLLGVRVVREEGFQRGDLRCAFRVFPDQPIDPDHFPFRLDPAAADDQARSSVRH